MIGKTLFILADSDVPYRNQAVEEQLLRTVQPGACILYLWQNRRTVVIGRNQNGRAECRAELLEQDGGYLARRLSGGGAVFHDLGNLNFSFIAADPDYSVPRQQSVILAAVRSLGLDAEISGRNDISVGGRKFSGNAFMSSGIRHCHHGTLLISADTSDMGRYLNVDPSKLQSKGVRSVRSRVVNLNELDGSITVGRVADALKSAFAAEYGAAPETLDVRQLDRQAVARLTDKFASDEWRLGAEPDFSYARRQRFPWGGAELLLQVSHSRISGVRLFTDALDAGLPGAVSDALCGRPFSAAALCGALRAQADADPARRQALLDISSLVMEVD